MYRHMIRNWQRVRPLWWAGALLVVVGTAASVQGQFPSVSGPGQPVILPGQLPPAESTLPQPLPREAQPLPGAPAAQPAAVPAASPLPLESTEEKAGEIPPKGEKPPLEVPPPARPSESNGCASGRCGKGHCVPGRTRDCNVCTSDAFWCRCMNELYRELCCPDHCYEGKWLGVADAALFVEGTRPVTQTRIRWDAGLNFTFPDRSEFFWARSGGGGKGPGKAETSLDFNELSLYQEVAGPGASFFVNVPYRSIDPDVNNHASGFGDIDLGIKTLWLDRDLLQVGFMFRTYLPSGNAGKGLGTGHVSLEPSLLATLKLTPTTYMQGQLSEWIPLGGDSDYAGALLHYHLSLNQVLWGEPAGVQWIGTLEFSGYSFQDGNFTDPVEGQFQQSSRDSYLYVGPGLRVVVCEWLDVGVGAAFALDRHGPDQLFRLEMRIRY